MEILTREKIKLPNLSKHYCNSLTEYSRYRTREVKIGSVPLGGSNPIRIQSMTTTDTMDTNATIEQSVRIIEAGADYVRITAPSIKDAANLENIKRGLRERGYDTPLIADIHFTPNAAELAARIVEKVRVNPGNYADKKKFAVIDYTDEAYDTELERIRLKFTPLVKICKEYSTAMRIGTNHGSLSDRIMSRYGDSPIGMVESALEFLRICEDNNFYDIVLSMKASNPRVMVEAYRLLINKMEEENMNYPLHLGVTEAGEGEDGRIKSAIGMGALLEDGIGDTVRVSLTEEPEFEIPVARALVERYSDRAGHSHIPEITSDPLDPFSFEKRATYEIDKIGALHVPVVMLTHNINSPDDLSGFGYSYDPVLDKWNLGDMAADLIYLKDKDISFALPGTLKKVFDFSFWKDLPAESRNTSVPLLTAEEYLSSDFISQSVCFISVTIKDIVNNNDSLLKKLEKDKSAVLILTSDNEHAMAELRRVFIELINKKLFTPVILRRNYTSVLHSSTDLGSLFLDGLGDGIWLESPKGSPEVSADELNRISFGILQAARTRISKTEYISCPSCGRTLFDLQETTAKIRSRTSHLKGVKIGIMGCIVNGPGEMADADYGYVGSGPGKITLYKGKEVVKRNINAGSAVDALIELIRSGGDWVEKVEMN
jgi:(E)-4-hydroxy-3-methylbut-2-enyl-diphosphate synthase